MWSFIECSYCCYRQTQFLAYDAMFENKQRTLAKISHSIAEALTHIMCEFMKTGTLILAGDEKRIWV